MKFESDQEAFYDLFFKIKSTKLDIDHLARVVAPEILGYSNTTEFEENAPASLKMTSKTKSCSLFPIKKEIQGTELRPPIVKAQSGSMDVRSQPGRTIFTIKPIG